MGSVRDFFKDQSYGKLDVEFDVVGPVCVSEDVKFYGRNDPERNNNDANVREMVREACKLVDEKVNFADYDWDGDGEVEQIYLIYAGYGEAAGGPAYTIWPHKSILASNLLSALKLDGVYINTYACSSELAGRSGSTMNGIGTACHEFSHCLGLPDIYDVNYNGGIGMSYWDVMSSGSYNGPNGHGEVPSGYSAFERWMVGWLEYTELKEMCRVKDMPPLHKSPVAYTIVNDACPSEYFIIENRQPEKWFSYTSTVSGCHGILISHIDFDKEAWEDNSVNTNPGHQRFSYVPADGVFGSDSSLENGEYLNLMGDLFPGINDVAEFSDETHFDCGGSFFNPDDEGSSLVGKPLSNIRETQGGYMAFDFMGGIYVPKPHIIDVAVSGEDSFRLTWGSEKNLDAVSVHAVEIKEKSPMENRLLDENFTKFKTNESEGGAKDTSILLNLFMSSPGWSGKDVYTYPTGARVGMDANQGYLITPMLRFESGFASVKFTAASLENGPCKLNIQLLDDSGEIVQTISQNRGNALTSDVANFNFSGTEPFRVKLSAEANWVISGMSVFDGNYKLDDLSLGSLVGSLVSSPEEIRMDDVKDITYSFNNLKGKKYKIRIKGKLDGAYSEWTDFVEVDLSQSGIEERVVHYDESVKAIYTIDGRKVDSVNGAGMYIIDYGTHRKKILK